MRITSLKIYLSFAIAAALMLCGCTLDEPAPSRDGMIQVVARMTPFAETQNETKSGKNQYEVVVKNMAMFVFDSDGNKVDYTLSNSSQPLFLIDRTNEPYSTHNQSKMAACKLYILANIPTADQTMLENIQTETDFLNADCTIHNVIRMSGIDSYGGLPMWGVITETKEETAIDLRSASTALVGEVLTIPLTCMMSKLTFNIKVDPVQKSDYIQRFELKSWTVENAPSDVQVRQPSGTSVSAHAVSGPFLGAVTFGQVDNGVNPIMQGASTPMTFCCYVPEQRVNPSGSVSYPAGIDQISKQNFKPRWLTDDDKPLKVTLRGVYTDHRNLTKEVTYTIYPGRNNYDDFFVDRNTEYIHDITIMGISNSNDADELSVSLDTRVDVQQNDFQFHLERETLLDSHWEIRPIRITLDPVAHPDADRIEVEIMNGDMSGSNPWIRFEAPTAAQISSNASLYCDVPSGALSYGKRRYFTTDLVTNTLKNNKLVSFNATDASNTGTANEHAIWVYIDENTNLPSTPGSTVRQATVQCRYYEKNQTVPTVTENYYFAQKSLHNITYNDRIYGIEYYEEYLYNYDAREHYGETTDGMAWGLNGMQLSYEDRAIYFEGGFASGIVNSFISGIDQNLRVYDFYLTKDESADGEIEHPYSGRRFTKRIAKKVGIGQLATNALPNSAIEYCLNKNKRLSGSGTVDMKTFRWYMPAIDEIEDICMGGYSYFEVFQDKYYWSSQPSYQVFNWTYTSLENNGRGMMFLDNKNRARATKVNNEFHTDNSGQDLSSAEFSYALTRPPLSTTVNVDGPNATGNTPKFDPGNQPRSNVNRIRCAYKEVKRVDSVFGFESGTTDSNWTADSFSRNNGDHRTGSYAGYSNSASTTMTTKLIEAPMSISFYVRHSGSYSATWALAVSTDGLNWTTLQNNISDTSSFWTEISADLSSYEEIYIRITSTSVDYDSGWFSTEYAKRYIDDITLTYYE